MTEDSTALMVPTTDPAVQSLETEVKRLLAESEIRVVASDTDMKSATEDLSIMATLKKTLTERKVFHLTPLNDRLKDYRDIFTSISDPLDLAIFVTKAKVLAYQREEQRKRDEADAIRRQEEDIARRKAALKGEPEPETGPKVVTAPVATISRTDVGQSHQKMIAKWKLLDLSLVPAKFLILNEVLVGKLVRAGETDIPGIEIWKEPVLAVTSHLSTPPGRKEGE